MTVAGAATVSTIHTERLRIVPFERRHLTERYVGWLNDPVVTRYSEQRHRVHTIESCAAYARSFEGRPDRFLAVETLGQPPRHIGNLTVTVDPPNGLADLSILIGERNEWGRGYGVEAWRAVLEGLIREETMRKVTGGASAANVAMIAIMRKCGMVEDGIRCRHLLIDDVPTDVVYFAAFANEWGRV